MEENKRTDSGYTGEYGNPVEHNDAPQVETENAAAYSETAQSASEQGASAQAEQSSTYSYSYKNGEGTRVTPSVHFSSVRLSNVSHTL